MSKREREEPKPLLVLDIAGVLIDGDAMTAKRKGLEQFLSMVFDKYHVVSWTSRKRYKVKKGKRIPAGESRTKHAFANYRDRLVDELYGEDTRCSHFVIDFKPVCFKNIDQLLSRPKIRALDIDRSQVVVLDDSPIKWILEDGLKCYHPPKWDKSQTSNVDLDQGGKIYNALSKSTDPPLTDDKFWIAAYDDPKVRSLGGGEFLRANVFM